MPQLSDERIAEIRKVVSKGWSIEIVPTSDLTLLLDEVAEGRKVVVMPRNAHAERGNAIYCECRACGGAVLLFKNYCPDCGVQITWKA